MYTRRRPPTNLMYVRGRGFGRKIGRVQTAIFALVIAALGVLAVFISNEQTTRFRSSIASAYYIPVLKDVARAVDNEAAAAGTGQCSLSWKTSQQRGAANNYYNPRDYPNNKVSYFNDLNHSVVFWQSEVYNIAAHLAEKNNGWIIDVGGGSGIKAANIYNSTNLNFVELDFGNNLVASKRFFSASHRYMSTNGSGVKFYEWDISKNPFPKEGLDMVPGSTIVSADVIEHLKNPDVLVDSLLSLFYGCSAENLIISTINRRSDPKRVPDNKAHVREWTKQELEKYLVSRGAEIRECRLVHSSNRHKYIHEPRNRTALCLLTKSKEFLAETMDVRDFFPYDHESEARYQALYNRTTSKSQRMRI